MYTKLLMISSALFLAVLGFATSLLPQEVLAMHGSEPDNATGLLIQMMGALYLGFALLNWTTRGTLVDHLPVALGNFLHFAIVGVMLAKEAIGHGVVQLAISALVFSLFAIGFGIVVFGRPQTARPADK